MNIFYLDKNPVKCAEYHCDKHVSKMIVEYAQLLSTAHHILDGESINFENLYKPTHFYHPCSKWVRQSHRNYLWLWNLAIELLFQYSMRYGRRHKSANVLLNCNNPPLMIELDKFTDPPQCMPDEYTCKDTIQAYRNYYNGDKAKFARWKLGNIPYWFKENE